MKLYFFVHFRIYLSRIRLSFGLGKTKFKNKTDIIKKQLDKDISKLSKIRNNLRKSLMMIRDYFDKKLFKKRTVFEIK